MEDIIDYLCKKHGMSRVAMKAICESPFRFIAEEMRSGEFKNFNVIGLGKFALKSKYKIEENLEEFKKKNETKSKRSTGGVEESDLGES
jgi:hypothetical protein